MVKSNETLDYALKEMQQQRLEDREAAKEERLVNRDEHKKIFDMMWKIQSDNKSTRDMISEFIWAADAKFVKQREFDKLKNSVSTKMTVKTALIKWARWAVAALIWMIWTIRYSRG